VIAYVDASVLLRVALGQPDSLPEWSRIDRGISSALVMAESLRTLDRLRLRVKLGDPEVAKRRATILELVASLELVDIDAVVLERASQPMPTELGTLDAIHLATALLWKELTREELTMATHDGALALAAQAYGLPVIGARRN
jgi:predicted nucleic acid-binding protein